MTPVLGSKSLPLTKGMDDKGSTLVTFIFRNKTIQPLFLTDNQLARFVLIIIGNACSAKNAAAN